MNPNLDQQPRHNQRLWPNPADTPLDRARRIAGMYRARLGALDAAARDECDHTAASFGEDWMLEKPDIIDPDRELTAAEAAELVHARPNTIHHWARLNHPDGTGRPLLPRFGWRGRERTFIAGKVLEAASLIGKGQHAAR
jgi:hypothetical protein